MTELEQKIVETAQDNIHLLYYWDKVALRRIVDRPDGAELTDNDRLQLEHLGKAFGLIPKTPAEVESDRRNRMKRHPRPGPLKYSAARRRRRY